jgi:hypothetical protein
MGTIPRQGRGKPRVYAEAPLAKHAIAVHPDHLMRLREAARARGVSVQAVIREIVAVWVRENGVEDAA